jgi:hypothetical protein
MALSTKAKKRFEAAMARRVEATEVTTAIDAATADIATLSGAGVGGALTNTHIMVGDGSGVAVDVAVSGDATMANTGALTVTNAAVIGKVLTGFSSLAGTVGATDTILVGVNKLNGNEVLDAAAIAVLKNGTPTLTAQTPRTTTGALDTTSGLSTFTNAGSTYAVTLAAPSAQNGKLKIVMAGATMTGTVTLAMTEIITYPGGASTTLTFTSAGDCAILMAAGVKWIMVGGSAIAS